MARKASTLAPWAKAMARRMLASLGSTRTSEKSVKLTPWASSDCSAVVTAVLSSRLLSVNTATFCACMSAKSMPTSAVTPGPYRSELLANSKA